MKHASRTAGRSLCVVFAAWALSCGGSRTRDVAGDRVRVLADAAAEPAASSAVPAPPPAATAEDETKPLPRVLTRASTRALAVDTERVYFGDSADDAVFAIAKRGGQPVRIARRAPVTGSLVLDGELLTWIASPGNVVVRADVRTEATTILREAGIFVDLAGADGHTFIAEATGSGGAITRVDDDKAPVRVATVDVLPRAIAASSHDVIIASSAALLRTSPTGGPVTTIATGAGFGSPRLAGEFVYVVTAAPSGSGSVIARVPTSGGQPTEVSRVADGTPIRVRDGLVFYVTPGVPRLVVQDAKGGRARVLAEADAFAETVAMAVDDDAVYVATGSGEDGLILAVPRTLPDEPGAHGAAPAVVPTAQDRRAPQPIPTAR